jgi:hypothetical protein
MVRRTKNAPLQPEQERIEALGIGRGEKEDSLRSQQVLRCFQEWLRIWNVFQELNHSHNIETVRGESLITNGCASNNPSSPPAIVLSPEVDFGAITSPAAPLGCVQQPALSKTDVDQSSRRAKSLERCN